ncbi:MAG TPA: proteasome-activating nucleotidase [archaeon]|nr:proteasome-activating nucleotidase [archaeon]
MDGASNSGEFKKFGSNIYDYIFSLEEQLRLTQKEIQLNRGRNLHLENELKRLSDELKELKNPPLIVGSVVDVLGERAVVRNNNGLEFLVNYPKEIPLKFGQKVAMTQRNLNIVEVLEDSSDLNAREFEVIEKPLISFNDIGGLDDEINELEETVILPMVHPEKFEKLGIDSPKGILLFGPPGTGKTLLAKAVANKTNSAFIGVNGSELVKKYIGEGSKLVKEIFKLAREKNHAIIFIDEIDSVAAQRLDSTTGGDREVQRTLMQLLAEIDGFKEIKNVKIIGATNRMDIMDPALLRPGRFDRIIEIPLPGVNARGTIFKVHSKRMNLDKSVDFNKLVKITDGATGADIKAICMEAGIFALRNEQEKITMKNFEASVLKVLGEETEDNEALKKMYR